MTDMKKPQKSNELLLDTEILTNLAGQISEVMYSEEEISTLEQKLDDTLLEQVSRVLNRMEDNPSQIRDAEQVLMDIQEPYLGVALCQQYFLIRSELTLECVVRQLIRLAQSPDKKTAYQTRRALQEAAFSEIPRLQNVGCNALFDSGNLSEEELLGFSRANVDFSYKLQSVAILINKNSSLSSWAYVNLVQTWDQSLSPDQKLRYQNELYSQAKQFNQFQTAEDDHQEAILKEFFDAADEQMLSNSAKKMVQNAMASLPQQTVEYLGILEEERRSSPATVFILGTCAKRTPLATKALIDLGEEQLDTSSKHSVNMLKWIGQQLKRVKPDGCIIALRELIENVEEKITHHDADEALASLYQALETWEQGSSKVSIAGLLEQLGEDFEDSEIDWNDAMQVRFHFEKGIKTLNMKNLPESSRAVLVEAMRITYEKNPWFKSSSYLLRNYSAFSITERIVFLDVIGAVAQHQRGPTESKRYRNLRDFIHQVSQTGEEAERQKASEWYVRLTGEVLPSG